MLAIVELGSTANLQAAASHLTQALVVDPHNKSYRMTLAQVQAKQGKNAEAVANLQRIVRSDDETALPTQSAARNLLKQIEPGSRGGTDDR